MLFRSHNFNICTFTWAIFSTSDVYPPTASFSLQSKASTLVLPIDPPLVPAFGTPVHCATTDEHTELRLVVSCSFKHTRICGDIATYLQLRTPHCRPCARCQQSPTATPTLVRWICVPGASTFDLFKLRTALPLQGKPCTLQLTVRDKRR